MTKQITATTAKNNFGGMLDDVLTCGRVEIVKHGRVVAVVITPQELLAIGGRQAVKDNLAPRGTWGRTHMVPLQLAKRAQVVKKSVGFDRD
jgi:prevent-host-death family protein